MLEGDTVSTKPQVAYPVTVDTEAVKIIHLSGRDVTANYVVVGIEGKLEVCEPKRGSYSVTYARIDPQNPMKNLKYFGNDAGRLLKKPSDPTADGYVFLGWYIDRASSKEWNFDTDIIQSDLTLYAGWSKKTADSAGMALCVQDILPQTYTATAVKPTVIVYAADAKTRLKYKTDYTVTYKNNINADTMAFPDGVPQGGYGEALDDTTHGFHSGLPYVIIQGKGNYAGTVYVNFHISPADFAVAQTKASELTLKYADQLEVKPGRYGTVVTQLQYKKKGLRYNQDYTLLVEKAGGTNGESAAVSLNAKGQIPLEAGTYQATITGKGNFTGEITKTLYIADKTQLFKYAKVTCKTVISDVTMEQLKEGIQPENLVVKMNGAELAKDTYSVACVNNHAIGTAIVTVMANESGYFGSKQVTFQIKGGDFKEKAIQIDGWLDELSYTGKPLTQNDVVLKTKDGRELAYGSDYVVSYKDNIQKGTAIVTFTANPSSGYSGSFHKKFKIAPMDLDTAMREGVILITGAEKTNSGWKLSERVPYQKGGAMPIDYIALRLTTSGAALECGKGKDYTVKYTNNKEVSNAAARMVLQGSGNYTGSVEIYYDIEKASLYQLYQQGRVTITAASIKVPYPHGRIYQDYGNGYGEWLEDELKDPDRRFEPAITIKDGRTALKKNVDFTVEYIGNTRRELEGGDLLVVQIKGNGNYGADDDVIELNVSVNQRTLSNANVEVTIYENAFTYTGEQILPEVLEVRYMTFSGYGNADDENYEQPEWEVLKLGEDYRIAYTKNVEKGTGAIKIIGMGAYKGSATKAFQINSKEIYNKSPK